MRQDERACREKDFTQHKRDSEPQAENILEKPVPCE
jgi:hypothetical protein